MTTPLGGGVGGTHEELCGVFTAGLLIIGALHGRSSVQENDSSQAYALAKEYRARFSDRWGTLTCDPIREWAKGPAGPGSCAFVAQETALILLDLLEAAETRA
jgi:hypothetical protein